MVAGGECGTIKLRFIVSLKRLAADYERYYVVASSQHSEVLKATGSNLMIRVLIIS